MTEMINHATVHKDLLHHTVNQKAFVCDQADFPAGKRLNRLISRCALEPTRVQITIF